MRPTHSFLIAIAATIAGLGLPLASSAQFAQYTPPGGPGAVPVNRREALETAVEDARWRFGGVRVDYWLGLRTFGSVDVVGEETGLTASAGAGLRFYLPTGSNVIWAAHALPEYSWVETSSSRSRVNGRYGAGFFGFFNRLTVEATTTRQEALDILSPQVQQRVNARGEGFDLQSELRLAGSVSLYLGGNFTRYENLLEEEERTDPAIAPFNQLNRDETVLRAGIRYRTRNDWLLGVGAEDSDVEFADVEFDRSNEGTSPFVELQGQGRSFRLSLNLVWRDLTALGPSSDFVDFDELTGTATLGLGIGSRFSPTLYARRQLVYALGRPSYFLDDRLGARVGLPLVRQAALSVFAETGVNDYEGGTGPLREDDVTAYGGSLSISIGQRWAIGLSYSTEDFDSNLPGLDRTVDVVNARIRFRGLSLGDSDGPWY